MNWRNNIIYNLLKKNYYKYWAYRKLKPIWKEKKLFSQITFKKQKFFFVLEKEYNTPNFFKPVYLSSNIGFFNNEIGGYFRNKNLPKKGFILDLGAYHGGFSTYLSKNSKDYLPICFEPDPKNIFLMKKNFKMNKIKKYRIIPKGVWFKKDTVYFDQTGATGSISKSGKLKIQVTDLDSELKRLKIPYEKVSFIKMDIEGAEIEAIDGMIELLTEGSPQLAIASYHIRDGQKTYIEVEKKLKALGYKVETGYPKHLTTWAWKE